MTDLNVKQIAFAQEYVANNFNGTVAAIKAGYAKGSADTTASRLLVHDKVVAYIEELKRNREMRTQVDADWLLTHCSQMLLADIADILDDEDNLLPIKQWPLIWRQMLVGVDVKELFERDITGKPEKIGELIKAKFVNREKILELTGRHVSVKAFESQSLHLHVQGDIVGRLQEGRQRVIEHAVNLKRIEEAEDE